MTFVLLHQALPMLFLSQLMVGPEHPLGQYAGLRSAAMGGVHYGLGDSNDAIHLNPAGLAIKQRYSFDVGYAYDTERSLGQTSLSIVDSKTNNAAGGFFFTWIRGDREGRDAKLSRYDLATGFKLGEGLNLGVTGHYLSGRYTELSSSQRRQLKLFNGTAGLMLDMGALRLGIVYRNFANTKRPDLLPKAWGAGLGFSSERFSLGIDADWHQDPTLEDQISASAGFEWLLSQHVGLRGGYKNRALQGGDRENLWTTGLVYINEQGSLDASFVQSADNSEAWQILGAFKIQM